MSNKLNPKAVFLATRDHLYFYTTGKEKVIDLPLSTEIVQDLEIISETSLVRVLNSWIEQFKIDPQQAVLVLDDSALFHKELESVPEDDEEITKNFLALVPFRNVLLKTFPMKKGAYMLAVNQGFLRPLIDSFEQMGFIIVSVSPAFIFGANNSEKHLNKDLALQMLNNLELLLNYNFLSEEEVEAKLIEPQPFLSVKFNKKLIFLILVFVILIGVLAVLLKMQGII